MSENVAATIEMPRPARKVMRTPTPDEIRELVRVCQREPLHTHGRLLAVRNEAIVLTLYNTGLRASELVSLELWDLDLDGGLIHVRHGNGRKQRTVAAGKRLRQLLWRYLQVRACAPGPLFVGKVGDVLLRTSPHAAVGEAREAHDVARKAMQSAHAAAKLRGRVHPLSVTHFDCRSFLGMKSST